MGVVRRLIVAVSLTGVAGVSLAQTVELESGRAVFRSTGGATGVGGWNLWSEGYAGSFIHLNAPADVQVTVNAAGDFAGGAWPAMDLHVGNQKQSWVVNNSAMQTYTKTVRLPAGTHAVRTEFLNDFYDQANNQDRNLRLGKLQFTAKGLTLVNPTGATAIRQAVFAAADSHIENHRKADAQLRLGAMTPGQSVQVKLQRHAFNFGTAVPGAADWGRIMDPNPAPGSNAANFQQRLAANFNALVPENAGKWAFTEPQRGNRRFDYLDNVYQFAQDNSMRARHHAVLWATDGGDPAWVNTLLTQALSGNAAAKQELRTAISRRIDDVVAHAAGTVELDIINESLHRDGYLQVFGEQGLAAIYNESLDKLRAAGGRGLAFLNEYNVYNWEGEGYGNWYRNHAKSVLSGLTPQNLAQSGIGTQYYTEPSGHDPERIYRTLQNLNGLERPITLTEFGVATANTADAARILQETMRLMFGSEGTTGFMMWGFWAGSMWDPMKGAALFDENWNITEAGKVYQQMLGIHDWGIADLPAWTTDLTLTADANGQISFRGFLGDYALTVDGQSYAFTLDGDGPIVLVVPEPSWLTLAVPAVLLMRRRTGRGPR